MEQIKEGCTGKREMSTEWGFHLVPAGGDARRRKDEILHGGWNGQRVERRTIKCSVFPISVQKGK